MRSSVDKNLIGAGVLLAALSQPALASSVVVTITDRSDNPIADVAAYLTPLGPDLPVNERLPEPAVMVQTDNRFVPHLLVVETGSQVSFPNDDTVSHHVYSFSDAKRFQLDLYRGNTHPPQLFDVPGLVVLGCNIHDSMLGYILVVDTPWHAVSDADGVAAIQQLSAGEYELHVWTPRADPKDLPPPQRVTLDGQGNRSLSISIDGKLRPPHDHGGGSLSWNAY